MIRKIQKLTIQVVMACVLVIAGLSLLFMGFFAVPLGEISASVLTAIGEVFCFSGALLGIDYSYGFKRFKYLEERRINRSTVEEDSEEDS